MPPKQTQPRPPRWRLPTLLGILGLAVAGLWWSYRSPGHLATKMIREGLDELERGHALRAETLARQALELQPERETAQLLLAQCLMSQNRLEESRQILQSLLDHGARLPHVRCRLAEVLLLQRRVNEAVQLAPTLLKEDPDCVRTQHIAAVVATTEQNRIARIAALERAYELGDHDVTLVTMLVNLYLDSNQLEKAEKLLHEALQRLPDEASLHILLGLTYNARDDAESHHRARESFQRALRCDPNAAPPYYELALLDLEDGDRESALNRLQTAIRLDPYHPGAHQQLGMLYQRMGREEESRAELARYRELQRAVQEVKRLDRMTTMYPDNIDYYRQLVEAKLTIGDWQGAIDRAREGLKVDPDDAALQSAVARAQRELRGPLWEAP